MGSFADTAARIEINADILEEHMPEVAKAIRNAAEVLRDCDKYSK